MIGRERECVWLADALGSNDLPRAIVITGEPGIGKTTLWRWAVDDALGGGYRVLQATPGATPLQFETLGDLLTSDLSLVRRAIPTPQLRALEIALLLRDPEGEAPEPRAIALGALTVMSELAKERPLLVAIDDAHWLDAASAMALSFAARRLADRRIALLIASRDDAVRTRLELDRALGARITRVHVTPLTIGALHALFNARLGVTFRKPTLERIHETSGGNPLYALEIAMALQRSGDTGGELPLPRTIQDAMRERLSDLPRETLDALAVAALCATPTLAIVGAAIGDEDIERRLAAAIDAEVVGVIDGRVRFAHPLIPSVVVSDLTAAERRRWHTALADATPSFEERAMHLGSAASDADESAASVLEEASLGAARRGALAAATDLGERAARLTVARDVIVRRRRLMLAAQHAWTAGDYDRGRRLLDEALQEATGRDRAQVLHAIAANPRNIAESIRLAEEALANAGQDMELRVDILGSLALLSLFSADIPRALRYADEAVAAAGPGVGELARRRAIGRRSMLRVFHGDPVDLDELASNAERELAEVGLTRYSSPSWYFWSLLYLDRLDEVGRYARRLYELARSSRSILLQRTSQYLAQHAHRVGDWPLASRYANEALELAEQYGVEHIESEDLALRAMIETCLGLVDAARATAERMAAMNREAAEPMGDIRYWTVRGLLELSLGDNAAAARWLVKAVEGVRRGEIHNPAAHNAASPFAVLALIGSGDVARAEETTAYLEGIAGRLRTPRAYAVAARSRGLVRAATGDLDGALADLVRALKHHEDLPVPFERGITLLSYGQLQRRAKQKAAARETLSDALAIFERLPAPLWAEKARAELARIGGRPPTPGALTPTEERIAALVAEGKTNKEVSAALFVNVATVEAALTRIYSKLGIRSRADLARLRATAQGSQAKH